MSIFSSLKSEAITVLLWGDRWWLPRHRLPVPFADPGQAAALLAAAWPGAPRRLRLIYQPDDFVTVPVACPQADRATLGLVLAEEHAAVCHPGLAWSFEPILRAGDGYNTLLHHEARPALFGLVHQLHEHGFQIDSVWPLASWLNALPPDLSDSGAMTLVALSAERFHLYRHSPEGVRSVESAHGDDALDKASEALRTVFEQNPDEFVLYVTTDDGLLDTLNQRLKLGGSRVIGHFAMWEALAKPAVISARHPAQLLPPGAALWPARLLKVASVLIMLVGVALAGDYVLQLQRSRQETATLAEALPALRREVEDRRKAVAQASAQAEAGRPEPWSGPLLRAIGRAPAAVTLTSLQASRDRFVIHGGVAANGALTESAWGDWLAQLGGETWQITPTTRPAGTIALNGLRR